MKEAGIHDGSELSLEECRLQCISNLEFQEARNFGRQPVCFRASLSDGSINEVDPEHTESPVRQGDSEIARPTPDIQDGVDGWIFVQKSP
jgi:hypothetical protein